MLFIAKVGLCFNIWNIWFFLNLNNFIWFLLFDIFKWFWFWASGLFSESHILKSVKPNMVGLIVFTFARWHFFILWVQIFILIIFLRHFTILTVKNRIMALWYLILVTGHIFFILRFFDYFCISLILFLDVKIGEMVL